MWSDNQTSRDLLNFQHVADIAAERIFGARGQPLSIGISGGWGMGKSSMMELLHTALQQRAAEKAMAHKIATDAGNESKPPDEVRFVHFNAWLYQGHDDARAALMEAIAQSLVDRAEADGASFGDGVVKKAKGLLARVKWFRVASMTAGGALALYTGSPLPLMLSSVAGAGGGLLDGDLSKDDLAKIKTAYDAISKEGKDFLAAKTEEETVAKTTPPKAIDAFRADLEATLKEMKITLVVLIDDLDRCLPETAIATLEAMRLFLFLHRTAFVIAADEDMIRESVRVHFKGAQLSEGMVRSYFDKLIQLPFRVPPLGTQDVRAYLMLLFIEASDLEADRKEDIRDAVCTRLGQTWNGARFDRAFVLDTIGDDCPAELRSRIAIADRIAPILTSSPEIRGNPRLIKRF
jgi:predicted KAP-like P-loop ATPase